jgi:hypothetical protein
VDDEPSAIVAHALKAETLLGLNHFLQAAFEENEAKDNVFSAAGAV